MDPQLAGTLAAFREVNLISDPIYGYLRITKRDADAPPGARPEAVEQDLVDHPWLQRMRRIHQLQSAWWVFPSAEHTRFQHVLGAMHLAGEIGLNLHDSLRAAHPDAPSRFCVEELLRVAGLLHDVGHGPFGHFFDDEHLAQYGLTHETISQAVITGELAPIISEIRRSPSGPFADGERLDPSHVAALIRNDPLDGFVMPGWLEALKPVFCGLYTADNMDYVQRDSYYSGVRIGPVDVRRIVHYSFIGPRGLTLHKHGEFAALMFLNARMYLYNNLYFHRTVRAIDLHLREIFAETMELLGIGRPLDDLDAYLRLNEWSLIIEMENWARGGEGRRRAVGAEWVAVVQRNVKWRTNFEQFLFFDDFLPGTRFLQADEYEDLIRRHLPLSARDIDFRVDLASSDHRALNPLADTGQIVIYDATTDETEAMRASQLLARMPIRTTVFRVFSTTRDPGAMIAAAARAALRDAGTPSIPTNV